MVGVLVLFPFIFLYGFLRWSARHLVLAFIYLVIVWVLAFKVFNLSFNSTGMFDDMVVIVFGFFVVEYIIALIYDVVWGWKHPHEIKSNRMSGAVYIAYPFYLITYLMFIPVAYGIEATSSPSAEFSIVWYILLLTSILFGFGSVAFTIETRFKKQIDNSIEKVKEII